MKCKVSKYKKHNFCNTNNSEGMFKKKKKILNTAFK